MRWIIVDKKVPVVRFKGFTDDWEQHKLGDLIENYYNGQTPSRNKVEYWGGTLNWLTSGELNRGIVTKTKEKITEIAKNKTHLKVVPKGTFVIAITGLEAEGTRGNCAILGIDTTLNQSCMALFTNSNLIKVEFLFQWYRKRGNEFGIRYTQGTKQQSYNATILNILPISVPSLSEQERIQSILLQLDNIIALYQEQLNLYQQLQKELLQRMFVSHRQSNPTIRFSKFYDTWELQVISKCFKNIRNAFVGTATPFYVDKGKGHFYLESNNVKNGTINRDKQIYINEEFYLKQSDKLLHSGDMVMVQSGSVGNSAIIPPELDSTAAHALIMFQSPQEKINSKFINFFFQTSEAKSELRNITTGNTIQHILASDMAQFKIKIPTKSEQNKIQKLFDTTVHIIDFYNKRINDVL
ncbi:type I restriction-modification system specificity subunit [Companilactobacillus versmoldensis DSM 14857 = KCTC 3814]|uniref:Type I restriction-modification system specificity subunit n=1 Tax=Companilactobacillus versmoldensis DSM 14857 = KCTC 3814 TaxID=1423815 RepID=A0A0R1SAH9_9LACO|nr:type I restriction-modification system specificity subunit [Companilactobacillus versmoldensis DSM 14857 = KCTC 3814]